MCNCLSDFIALDLNVSSPTSGTQVITTFCRVRRIDVYASDYFYLLEMIFDPKCLHESLVAPVRSPLLSNKLPDIKVEIDPFIPSISPSNFARSLHKDSDIPFSPFSVSKRLKEEKEKKGIDSIHSKNFTETSSVLSNEFDNEEEKRELREDKLSISKSLLIAPLSMNIDQNGNNRSQMSASERRSSTSSSSTAMSIHGIFVICTYLSYLARLNSFAQASQSQGLGIGLKRLMVILLFSLLLDCILAVVKFGIMNSMYSTYLDMVLKRSCFIFIFSWMIHIMLLDYAF